MKYLSLFLLILTACGRAPSSLLRQGQLPIQDFPMFMTEGAAGKIWKVNRERTREEMVTGLNDPRGIATDKFGNLYVAEYGAGRILKINIASGVQTVLREGLVGPSMVAVDSVGEVFAATDGDMSIVRVGDGSTIQTFTSIPTAITFGVGDEMLIGLYSENKVLWQKSGKETAVTAPVAISTDGTGRVHVTEGSVTGGKIHRFHQKEPGTEKIVAENLQGPLGIVIDPAGNLFIAEQGASRIVLLSDSGTYFSWMANIVDLQYLAFTQY